MVIMARPFQVLARCGQACGREQFRIRHTSWDLSPGSALQLLARVLEEVMLRQDGRGSHINILPWPVLRQNAQTKIVF